MNHDEDFEIPTFLPPEHPPTGLVDIEVECPICDERRTVLFTPDYMEDPSFADRVSEVWRGVCEDCQTLAVNFCHENGMDAESSDSFQKRLDYCSWDIAVINIMRRYREIHHGVEGYCKRLLPVTAACPVCGVEHSWAIQEVQVAPFGTTVLSWPCIGCNGLFHFFCEVHNFPAEIIDRSFWDLVNNRGDIGSSLKEYRNAWKKGGTVSHDVLDSGPETYRCPVCDRVFEVLMDEENYLEQCGYAPETVAGVQLCAECMDEMRINLDVCSVDPDEVEDFMDDLWDCDPDAVLYAKLGITGKEEE